MADTIALRRAEVTARLDQLEEERRADALKRRVESDRLKDPKESVELYTRQMTELKDAIEASVTAAKQTEEITDREDIFASLNKLLVDMQKLITDSSLFLPAYDVRQGQATIKALNDDVQTARDKLLPKKKFRFKARTRDASKTKGPDSKPGATPTTGTGNRTLAVILASQESKTIADVQNQVITVTDLQGKDLTLSNLSHCTVLIDDSTGAIFVKGLASCTVIAVPTLRSVHLNFCTDSVFVLASQQMRLHDSSHCDFYVHVNTGGPIIQDCTNLRFAPYLVDISHGDEAGPGGVAWGSTQEALLYAKLQGDNQWRAVKDFNYPGREQSPNWDILPEAERQHYHISTAPEKCGKAGAGSEN